MKSLTKELSYLEAQCAVLRSHGLAKSVVERLTFKEAAEFDGLDRGALTREFASRLSIRPVRVSRGPSAYDVRVIDVGFTASDPQLAAAVANAVCEAFIDREAAERIAASEEAIAGLRKRRAQVVGELAECEGALRKWESRTARDREAAKGPPAPQSLVSVGAVMKKEIEAKQRLVDSLTSHLAEECVSQNLREATSQIAARAMPPAQSLSVPRGRSLGDGLAMGVIVAIAFVAAFELLDWRVWDVNHVRQHLGLPAVAWVTQARRSLASGSTSVLLAEPESGLAEDFRRIRAKLLLAPQAAEWRSLAAVSTRRDEGCSTVVANLGVAVAGLGKRVLLVDVDLAHPSLHETFGLNDGIGLGDTLAGKASHEEVVQRTAVESLFVVPSGASLANPSELLGGETMSQFAKWATDNYDIVLYDTPPLSMASEGLAVASRCDAVLVVVREGSTNRFVARRCLDELEDLEVRTVGAVLNGHRPWGAVWHPSLRLSALT